MSRFVRPDTTRLELSNGDWILVKQRLTHGELRAQYAALYRAENGHLRVNPLQVGVALVTSYLLDWSLTDDAGKPVAIRGLSVEALTAVLDSLEPDSFGEIRAAIEAHETAQLEAREQEKKRQGGGTDGAAISPLRSAAAGTSAGFVN